MGVASFCPRMLARTATVESGKAMVESGMAMAASAAPSAVLMHLVTGELDLTIRQATLE